MTTCIHLYFLQNCFPWILFNPVVMLKSERNILKHLSCVNDQKKKPGYYYILHAPYTQGFTQNLQKKLCRFNIEMVRKKEDTIKQIVTLNKSSQWCSKISVSVNLIEENIKAGTLGKQDREGRREFVYQHQNDVKNGKESNAIFMHLQEHNDHSIQCQEVSYLEYEDDWRREIKETISMQWTEKK